MIGRDASREASIGRVGYDRIDTRSAFYERDVAYPAMQTPLTSRAPGWTTLKASNKTSEHNILNLLETPIVMQQHPAPVLPPDLGRRISNRSVVRRGSQSLART